MIIRKPDDYLIYNTLVKAVQIVFGLTENLETNSLSNNTINNNFFYFWNTF